MGAEFDSISTLFRSSFLFLSPFEFFCFWNVIDVSAELFKRNASWRGCEKFQDLSSLSFSLTLE